MKNSYIKYLFIVCLIFFGNISCEEDYLELEPLDSPSDASFLRTEAEVNLAVTGIYNPLYYRPIGNIPFTLYLDNITDIAWDRSEFNTRNYDSQTSLFSSTWDNYYEAIGRCNFFLENINRAESEVKSDFIERSIGEVKFLRAYYYHLLSELYGDVPLVTTPQGLGEESLVARTSKEQVTDFIIEELLQAKTLLPMEYGSSETGRATSGAALSLLSRVALHNERWQDCIDASKEVMDSGAYTLFPDYEMLFKGVGEQSDEVIFDIQFQTEVLRYAIRPFFSRNAGGFMNRLPLQTLVDRYECVDGLRIDESSLYDSSNPFVNRDPRLDQTIARPGSIFLGYQFETHPDSVRTTNFNTDPPSRINNLDVTSPFSSFSGYAWRKYVDDKDLQDRVTDINIILIRYAEVLLNFAEAKIESNQIDQSVYDAINEIRDRASVGMPPITSGKSADELRTLIRRERVVELAGEGFRLFDIRRWRLAEEVLKPVTYGIILEGGYELQGIPSFNENETPDYSAYSDIYRVSVNSPFNANRDYLWAIPQKDIDVNPNLNQNPGY
tara:strand:+ start:6312 stop:7973 length:1662 start_codon:yes stop_codon:yes gene_type:complete